MNKYGIDQLHYINDLEKEIDKLRNRMYVGVAGVIFKRYHKFHSLEDMRFLVIQRFNSHGSNSWALCGGHVDQGENPLTSIKREVFEEFGYDSNDFKYVYKIPEYTISHFEKEKLSYLTIYYLMELSDGKLEPTIKEPDKCKNIRFVKWGDWPQPLFLPLQNLLDLPNIKNYIQNIL